MNLLIHGSMEDVLPKLNDNSVDFCFADLPYNNKVKSKRLGNVDLQLFWKEIHRIVKPNGAIACTAQFPFSAILAASNISNARYEWIWEKPQATGHLNSKKMPMKAHESVLIFYRKLPTYNPQMTDGHEPVHSYVKRVHVQNRSEIYGRTKSEIIGGGSTLRFPRSIQKFKCSKNYGNIHPTQKPVELLEFLIRTYTDEGQVILDPCSGSATTAVASYNTGRGFICIERDGEWYSKSMTRVSALTEVVTEICI